MIYQGTELWDFSLMDPDNRRPVDYQRRIAALREEQAPAELLANWRDGGVKLLAVKTLLRFRREHAALFASGTYEPAKVNGKFADCCIAFSRASGNERIMVAVPRLAARIGYPPVGGLWKDTSVEADAFARGWRDLVAGRRVTGGCALPLSEVFGELPFAVLLAEG